MIRSSLHLPNDTVAGMAADVRPAFVLTDSLIEVESTDETRTPTDGSSLKPFTDVDSMLMNSNHVENS